MAPAGKEFFRERYESFGGRIAPVTLKQTIRVNTLKITAKKLLERLSSLKVKLAPVAYTKHGYEVVKSSFSLGAITEGLLGYYYIQGNAAQLPVAVLDPKPGETVLDCCAAPGGKTTQIAQYMKNSGLVVAYELRDYRMTSLVTNLERCGVTNTVAFQGDISKAKKLGIEFDKILLDAPCSGNYITDEKWFDKRTLPDIQKNSITQRRLLRIAVELLRPGGVLVYSTCSLEPEENELNMQWALDNLPVSLAPVRLQIGDPGLTNIDGKELSSEIRHTTRFWPHKTNTEGFYIAKLVKHES